MNFYPHHIGDFNNSTRHLTRVERSVYRDAIELYYDTELHLLSDAKKLAKRLLCSSDEEIQALSDVLSEFFTLTDDGYSHDRCDLEIEKYRANTSAKARAGKASAEARKLKALSKKKQKSTPVEQVLKSVEAEVEQNPTNQEPLTINQEPIEIEKTCSELFSSEPPVIDLPTNKFNSVEEVFLVTKQHFDLFCQTYPVVDVWQQLNEAKAWLVTNPAKRKTKTGMLKFINTWLSREQNKGGAKNGTNKFNGGTQKQSYADRRDALTSAVTDYEKATNF